MKGGAVISDDRRYRYVLLRNWSDCEIPMSVTFVMLNPSTADAKKNDQTITKCIGFARRWGYDQIIVVNLFGYRSRFPHHLRDQQDPVGPDNDRWIKWALKRSMLVVPAWGRNGDRYPRRVEQVMRLIEKRRGIVRVECLGLTADGSPLHPLMPGYDSELEEFHG